MLEMSHCAERTGDWKKQGRRMEDISQSRGKGAVISVMTTSFMVTFIGSSTNLALPSIGSDLSSSALVLSWIVSGYILASATFLLPMGRVADLVGRRKIYLIGVILFTVLTFLCAVAWSNGSILLFRVLQGVAASMIYATGMAIISSVIPLRRRGRAMGLSVTATYAGLSLGPVLGGVMCQHLGWRSIFYFTTMLGVLSGSVIISLLKGEWRGQRGESFDVTGGLLYMAGLVMVLYGFSSIASADMAKYILLAGMIVLAGFCIHESRVADPLVNLRLFSRNVPFTFSNLAAMIHYSATFAVGFLISLYLQMILGYPPRTAGFVLLAQPVMMALFSSWAGSLSDRMEPRIIASAGMGLTSLGLFIFIFLAETTPLWLVIGNLMVIGLGFALFSSPNTNAIMASVDDRDFGVAASMVSTMRMIGMAVSMAIVTMLIARYVGHGAAADLNSSMLLLSFRIAFTVFSILCAAGVAASMARGDIRQSFPE
jgi:EmrB/QacA subfamily drug resistance transporter